MNLGLPELGLIGFLILVVFGIKSASKKRSPSNTAPQRLSDPNAAFQNSNIDYEKSSTNKT